MDYLERRGVTGVLSRRELLRRGAQLGVGAGALGMLAAACGDDDDDTTGAVGAAGTGTDEPVQLSGELDFLNYPGWIGAGEYAFRELHPDLTIKRTRPAPAARRRSRHGSRPIRRPSTSSSSGRRASRSSRQAACSPRSTTRGSRTSATS